MKRSAKRIAGGDAVSWIYTGKLYTSEFQAGCLATRIREEGFQHVKRMPRYVYVYKTKRGKYGVKFQW